MPRVGKSVLEHLARDAIVGAGGSREDAEVVAETLVWADARGHETQGLYLLPNLARRLRLGLVRSPANMVCERTAPAAAVLDADDGFGQVAGRRAMDEAIAIAREQGVGLCTVRRSHHYGAAGYYAARAAERGFVGMTWSNSMPKVAPHGGSRRFLGTNPLAFACPFVPGRPVIVDLATAACAGSSISRAERDRAPIPEGVALDAEGRPTTDAERVNRGGCLLPVGGAKGYGLGLLVEIMAGVLSGSAIAPDVGSMFRDLDRPAGTGHACLAIDIERFVPMSQFLARLGELVAGLKSVPRQEGVEEILFPGESRARRAEDSAANGVPVSDVLWRAITAATTEPETRATPHARRPRGSGRAANESRRRGAGGASP